VAFAPSTADSLKIYRVVVVVVDVSPHCQAVLVVDDSYPMHILTSYGLCVCVLVTHMSHAKRVNQSRCHLGGVWTCLERNHVLDGWDTYGCYLMNVTD